jgi:hypothetical protein
MFYSCAYRQILKVLHAYFIRKQKFYFYHAMKKIQKIGIITSLWLSITTWPKLKKNHKN